MALLHASSSSSVSPAKDYENAIKFYSQAIELNPSNAIYYGNRSLAYLRTECYGYALADATRAIEMDKKYIKGYYRRAASNMALGKFRAALRDYETVSRASGSRPAPEPGGCRGPAGGRRAGRGRCALCVPGGEGEGCAPVTQHLLIHQCRGPCPRATALVISRLCRHWVTWASCPAPGPPPPRVAMESE